ncbi:MAG: hypothetical protein J3R72DRAFT_12673 [Linnemannia gamsii]|nr:MAG: hypothetical protein J3R72DRAFT_12673 [Linnemannia gamsii]
MLIHFLTRPAMLFSLLFIVLTIADLPIYSGAQSSSSGNNNNNTNNNDGNGKEVQFPSGYQSCVACESAFASPSCQTILTSISQSSSASLSNSTLASCQCSSTFLSSYSSCVKCFTETNQVSLVFGSAQAPAQSSLEAYCKALPLGGVYVLGGSATATKTVTKTTTVTGSPTATPTRPSSAVALNWKSGGQSGLVFYGVLMVASLAIFSLP